MKNASFYDDEAIMDSKKCKNSCIRQSAWTTFREFFQYLFTKARPVMLNIICHVGKKGMTLIDRRTIAALCVYARCLKNDHGRKSSKMGAYASKAGDNPIIIILSLQLI